MRVHTHTSKVCTHRRKHTLMLTHINTHAHKNEHTTHILTSSHIYTLTHMCMLTCARVQDTNESKDLWKGRLTQQVDYLANEYDALLLGGLPASLVRIQGGSGAPTTKF
jgi:hypothetical protein